MRVYNFDGSFSIVQATESNIHFCILGGFKIEMVAE
jgi:hypothetical protein